MNAVMEASLDRVPIDCLRPILVREIERREGGLGAVVSEIAAARRQAEHTVARRLYSILHGRESHRDGVARPKTHVTFETADAILTALDLQDLWHTELAHLYEWVPPLEEDPEPAPITDLRSWWLAKQAKERAAKPRAYRQRGDAKLTPAQVEAAWVLYDKGGLSLRELGRRLWEKYGYASPASCANCLHDLFKLEGKQLRDRIEATVAASTKHGLASRSSRYRTKAGREHRARLRRERGEVRGVICKGVKTTYPQKGRPCSRPALAGGDYCVAHDPELDDWRREHLAAARAVHTCSTA